jgi:hypothetical protein
VRPFYDLMSFFFLYASEDRQRVFRIRLGGALHVYSQGKESNFSASIALIGECVGFVGLFLSVRTANELSVDTSRGEELQINVRPLILVFCCPAFIEEIQCFQSI